MGTNHPPLLLLDMVYFFVFFMLCYHYQYYYGSIDICVHSRLTGRLGRVNLGGM